MIIEAEQALLECEKKLRDLMARASSSGLYSDVDELMNLARSVGRLVENNPTENNNSSTTSAPALQVAPSVTASGRNKKTRRVKTSKYPKFVRSRSDLIKIGWSKKEKKEYQHRAPWSVVQSLTRHLNNLRGQEFTTEDILPLEGTDGAEIPSYQAYLCLAWLRMEGVIVKDGRQGYFIPGGNDVVQQAEKLWITFSPITIAKVFTLTFRRIERLSLFQTGRLTFFAFLK